MPGGRAAGLALMWSGLGALAGAVVGGVIGWVLAYLTADVFMSDPARWGYGPLFLMIVSLLGGGVLGVGIGVRIALGRSLARGATATAVMSAALSLAVVFGFFRIGWRDLPTTWTVLLLGPVAAGLFGRMCWGIMGLACMKARSRT